LKVEAEHSAGAAPLEPRPAEKSRVGATVSGSIVAEGGDGGKRREPGVACWWNAMGFLPKSGASAVQVAVRARRVATEAFVRDLGAHR